MIYVASPYTHPDPQVRATRARVAEVFSVDMVMKGHHVYSPIASWHHLATRFQMPKEYTFWRLFNISLLKKADELWVLDIPGWEKSVGVTDEIREAVDRAIPHKMFNHITFEEVPWPA